MPTGTADIGNHCDDCTTTIPLPFAVSLYDTAYSSAAISSNGNVQFTTSSPAFSELRHPRRGLRPDGLRLLGRPAHRRHAGQPARDRGGHLHGHHRHARFARLRGEWRTRYFGRGGQASFAVVFHEGTPVFDVYYGPSTESGSSATAGVQLDTTNYIEYSENQPNLTNGLRLTYAPCSITDSNDATPNNGVVQGTAGDDFLCGDSDPEVLRGEGGDDDLRGGGGADVLDGNAGADDMEGGAGTDRVSYNGRVSDLSVSIGSGTGDDGAAGEGDTVSGDVEDVRGGSGNDRLTGDDDANLLLGEGGDDDLFGQGGGDDLRGDSSNAQDGADEVHGGTGNDALRGYDGSDQHFGDDGNDDLNTQDGESSDTLSYGGGFDNWLADPGDTVKGDCEGGFL